MTPDGHLSPPDLLDLLDQEVEATVAALAGADPAAEVGSCPGWAVRDLVRHTGDIHRWALRRVTGGPKDSSQAPTDDELASWFADGGQRLHAALTAADPDAPCRGFETDVTIAFWIRRQAHETAMHRLDLELALSGAARPIDAVAALDGVHEVLEVFAPRQVALGRSAPPPYGALLQCPEGTAVLPGPDPVTVRGSACDLLCALWRRPSQALADDADRWQQVLASGLTP